MNNDKNISLKQYCLLSSVTYSFYFSKLSTVMYVQYDYLKRILAHYSFVECACKFSQPIRISKKLPCLDEKYSVNMTKIRIRNTSYMIKNCRSMLPHGLETKIIIKILIHPCYPRNFDCFSWG